MKTSKIALLAALALPLAGLTGCNDGSNTSVGYESREPYKVGVTTFDPDLPAEPQLPTAAQVCATLEASDKYVVRPDGALPPEADVSPAGDQVAADPAIVNPDQARIQAALDACGAAVDLEVGAAIAAADAAATAAQVDAGVGTDAGVPGVLVSGASGEELAKPQYKASRFAVRLVVSSTGPGDAFITGPLNLPSGVTLWIDKGVTVYGTRDVMAYSPLAAGPYCANTAVSASKAGSSSNCTALITGTNTVNSAVMGDGLIDSRAYAEIITSNKLYPLMKVDLTCSNTYAAYAKGTQAADNTPCDDGGTFVDSKSAARNMTWWDLAYLGNLVDNGRTGYGSQSNFRMMVFAYAKNLTLYRITLTNSANFHVVPSGVDGLTVWGVKVDTPTLAAYANPAGNMNPLYTGAYFDEDNVKNTDAFDPASSSKAISGKLTTGSKTTSALPISFDGYLKNFVFAYNYVNTGDDDMALKGSSAPSTVGFGVDGDRGARSDRKYGIMIAHNHFYWGHGISIGSETNVGVAHMHAYDNSFDGSEEALRIKSDYARGGEVAFIYYDDMCIRGAQNSLLFTPYYSTKALPSAGPLFPNFHDIYASNIVLDPTGSPGGVTDAFLLGFAADSGGYTNPQYPLVMSLTNVVSTQPGNVNVFSSNADLTLDGVNLPIFPNPAELVTVNGQTTQAVDPTKVVDCTHAYVDFPLSISITGTGFAP